MKRLGRNADSILEGSPTRADFVRLYEEYLPAVFNYCLFQVGSWPQAEDITADVFEQAWRSRKRYDPARGAFTTWLFAIARNRIIDSRRRQSRQPTQPLVDDFQDQRPRPEEQVAAAEQQAQLRHLLQTLPPEQQELIALKFGARLTNRYIAELLGKKESAVGSAVHRIMKKLRQQLSEKEIAGAGR